VKIRSLTIAMILALACASIVSAQGRQRRPAIKSTPKSAPTQSTLSIEAALVYNSGDVKPLARVTFFLLDDEIVSILQQAKLAEADRSDAKFTALRLLAEGDRKAAEAIAPHVVKSVTTDFSGRARFPAVPPKTYYVFGISEAPSAFWGFKVELAPGENSLIIDNKNIGFRQ
jgi:hypothetical protein